MNKNTETLANSSAAWGYLHPAMRPNAQGQHVIEIRHTYNGVAVLEALAEIGKVTIHRIGGNDLAAKYGFTEVVYSIN